MAKFRSTRNRSDEDIAGPSTDLVGKLVALRAEGEATVKTQFGPQKVTRARVLDLNAQEHLGIYLIFWAGVKKELATSEPGEWLIGTPVQHDQTQDPSRTYYELDATAFDVATVEAFLDAFENAENTGQTL